MYVMKDNIVKFVKIVITNNEPACLMCDFKLI